MLCVGAVWWCRNVGGLFGLEVCDGVLCCMVVCCVVVVVWWCSGDLCGVVVLGGVVTW